MTTSNHFRPMLIVGCSWVTVDPNFFPDAPVLWSVERDGVPLAIVKLLATPQPTVP
jgi:hypothetical protein